MAARFIEDKDPSFEDMYYMSPKELESNFDMFQGQLIHIYLIPKILDCQPSQIAFQMDCGTWEDLRNNLDSYLKLEPTIEYKSLNFIDKTGNSQDYPFSFWEGRVYIHEKYVIHETVEQPGGSYLLSIFWKRE